MTSGKSGSNPCGSWSPLGKGKPTEPWRLTVTPSSTQLHSFTSIDPMSVFRPLQNTRRDFFARCGDGLLGAALAQLLCHDFFGGESALADATGDVGHDLIIQSSTQAGSSRGESEVGDPVVHEWRTKPDGPV